VSTNSPGRDPKSASTRSGPSSTSTSPRGAPSSTPRTPGQPTHRSYASSGPPWSDTGFFSPSEGWAASPHR
jgi:hypothetical protein